jgi:predicted transcriptional regulator of viral defense system
MTEPIHITVPGSPEDPRNRRPAPAGVVIHYVPELHPDDVTIVNGLPVTSVARTLIDCAEEATRSELRELFERARERGILDMAAVRAARGRVEWRPSLAMLDEVIAEFS